jgi:NAD(P)-dependent dehydrogenase (short-subunit alcohol dehydrogenase family)
MARALITGCSTGIGRATAVELTKRGHEVVATARRPEVLGDLDVTLRLALDVNSDASVAAAVAAAGDIDILVNNAGISVGGPVEAVNLKSAQAMFETNFWGAARMVQAIAPGMRARSRGWIVNVTSLAGRAVGPLNGYYSASKWALEALSEAMEAELRHWGIRVIVIEPGYIDTPMLQKENEGGEAQPPYDELQRLWEAATAKLAVTGGGDLPGPELVAGAIADSLDEDDPHLRHPVGADAEMVVAARDSMSYEQFIATMRDFLGLDW